MSIISRDSTLIVVVQSGGCFALSFTASPDSLHAVLLAVFLDLAWLMDPARLKENVAEVEVEAGG